MTYGGWTLLPGPPAPGKPVYSREAFDNCGRQMTQYADENKNMLPSSVFELNFGKPCPSGPSSNAKSPIELPKFTPTVFGAPAGGVATSQAAGSRALPPGCVFYGMKGGHRVLLCPNARGKMTKRLEGLGAAIPESSDAEPFVWLAVTGLLLWSVTRKGKK